MNTEKLQRANTLNFNINAFKRALGCFDYQNDEKFISLNPRLIIEYDGEGREQEEIPISLNDDIIDYLKQYFKKEIGIAEKEFEAL